MKKIFSSRVIAVLLLLGFLSESRPLGAQGWRHIYGRQDTLYWGTAATGAGLPGGYVFAGQVWQDSFFRLATFEADLEAGSVQQTVRLNGTYIPVQPKGLTPVPAGGFTLLAKRSAGWSPSDTTVLLHVGANGQTVWRRDLSTAGLNTLKYLELLDDGDYLVSGAMQDSAVFLRLDAGGNPVWRLSYLPSGAVLGTASTNIHGLARTSANTYVQDFWFDSLPGVPGGSYERLLCVNLAGYFEPELPAYWAPDDSVPYTRKVVAQPGGNFMAIDVGLPDGIRFRRIDAQGAIFYQQVEPFSSGELFPLSGIFSPTQEGGFLVARKKWDDAYGQYVIALRTFDEWGAHQWETAIPVGNYDNDLQGFELYSVTQAANGNYVVAGAVVLDNFAHPARPLLMVLDSLGRLKTAHFTGAIRFDEDVDCLAQPAETAMNGWGLALENLSTGQVGYARTNDGAYIFQSDTLSLHRLQAILPNPYWAADCFADTLVSVLHSGDTVAVNFPMQPLVECPFLETDVAITQLRRCFDNVCVVRYCNTGTAAAENAYLRVTLDPFLNFVDAELPATAEANNVWRFDLGEIPVGYCGGFRLTAHLDCDSTLLGQTHCVEAHIYPDSICLSPQNWSGANVEVDGACHPDSVRFFIRNTGTAPTTQLDYIVIEDNIIFLQGSFTLPPGDSLPVTVPANGSTWRVESEQEPGCPYDPMPSATVEGCGLNPGGAFSIGFVSQFGEDDGDPFVSIDCQQNSGSFDPNDKQASPAGYGPEHYIEPGQPLEYRIRFQNTGTDTAFHVIIRDTLAPWLDPGSVVSGASSHPYRLEMLTPGYLKWSFDDIMLPDSNVNEAASHGFVKFQIRQKSAVPLSTVIQNRAAIYFDFNAPVLTNTTWHTIGENFVTGVTTPAVAPAAGHAWQLSPNPADGSIPAIFIHGGEMPAGRLDLFDELGRLVLQAPVRDNRASLDGRRLNPGTYFVRIWVDERPAAWAKWMIARRT